MKPHEIPQFPRELDLNLKTVPWRLVGIVSLVIVVFLLLLQCFVLVGAGERAVIYSKISGVKPYQLEEGLHLNIPVIYEPIIYDTRYITYTMSGQGTEAHGETRSTSDGQMVPDDSLVALTSDGLPVTADVSVRFHIDPENVWRLHQSVGPSYVEKVVRPQSRALIRMSFAEYPVLDVYSGRRQMIVAQIEKELALSLRKNHIILDEVLLRDIRFPDSFQAAIEQKQVAQQAAQQMVYEVDRARSERQQKVIEAEGEAAAIRAKANALTQNPQLVPYEYVQRLPDTTRVIITGSNTLISLGDVLGKPGTVVDTAPEPAAPVKPENGR